MHGRSRSSQPTKAKIIRQNRLPVSPTAPLSALSFCRSENLDRCQSGLTSTPGKRVYLNRYRGFESLPVRHSSSTQSTKNAPPSSEGQTAGQGRSPKFHRLHPSRIERNETFPEARGQEAGQPSTFSRTRFLSSGAPSSCAFLPHARQHIALQTRLALR